jgi:small basic protein
MSETKALNRLRDGIKDHVAVFERTCCNRKSAFLTSLAIYLALSPIASSAGIFGGDLCTAYNSIFDSELKTAASLFACAVAIILWFVDDGASKVKLWLLRIITGTLVLFNLPVIWGTVISRASVC